MNQDDEHTTPLPEAGEPEAHAELEPVDRTVELEAEVAALKDQLLRAMAETENVRRRLEIQAEERGKYAVSGFARDMLGVADNLRRALDSVTPEAVEGNEVARNVIAGVEITARELANTFERHGIRPVAALGEKFDPNLHQAMMELEDPAKPAGTVAMVMQTGYTIHDRLLRPAMVAVAKGGPRPGNGDDAGGQPKVDTTA